MNASNYLHHELVEIIHSPTSELSPAWYDTAQIVRTWITRPATLPDATARPGLHRLLDAQHPDGSWGYAQAPTEYRIVPTLAAATAFLEVSHVRSGHETARQAATAADAALLFITRSARRITPRTLPDTIAVELIVPSLLESIEQRLPPTHFAYPVIRSVLAANHDGVAALHRLRAAARAGATIPAPVHYALEVLGEAPVGYRHTNYLHNGCLACSPAATAATLAWYGGLCQEAVNYLSAEGSRLRGAWPTVAPVNTFEASWLIGAASRVGLLPGNGLAHQAGPWLAAQLREDGCAAGPALASDSDDTAIVLFALKRLGHRWSPHHLRGYEAETHFATFQGERTVSCSTNAHVLEVLLAAWRDGHHDDYVRRGIAKSAGYLLDSQATDGHWDDKWHASPLYATSCSVLALRQCAHQPRVRDAIARAIDWVLGNQRCNGSWGCWSGTREETAHAMHILFGTEHRHSVAKGLRFLRSADTAETPLWHGKELYEPRRIVDTLVWITIAAAENAGIG